MNFAVVIILLVITAYIIKISRWLHHWNSLPVFQPPEYICSPLSVVVAFRNESQNIGRLLESLKNQVYPSHLFEVILVDDYSDDGSAELVVRAIKDNSNFKCIRSNKQPGKKGALVTGYTEAVNELIVTTDADAYLSPEWLSLTSSFFCIQKPAFIMSAVNIHSGESFTQRFFVADFISLMASGACAAAGGKPLYSNGANIAFRKSVFFKINDAMNMLTASGDDTFLLHAIKKKKEKISFLKTAYPLVEVDTPASFSDFMNQHIRWASKIRYYSDSDILINAILVFLANISLLAAFIIMAAGVSLWLFILVFLVKGIADYRLLAEFYAYLSQKLKLKDFTLFSLIYPVYLALTAIAVIFKGYTWKGRRY